MRSPATFCSTLLLAAILVGCEPDALPTASDGVFVEKAFAGTGGLAMPQALNFDAGGEFVGEVLITIQAGWQNAPHMVDVTVTSVNGSDHFHGHQVEALSSLETFGEISQGLADVVVPWTTDESSRTVTDIYTVCAHIIFADNHAGEETCVGGF